MFDSIFSTISFLSIFLTTMYYYFCPKNHLPLRSTLKFYDFTIKNYRLTFMCHVVSSDRSYEAGCARPWSDRSAQLLRRQNLRAFEHFRSLKPIINIVRENLNVVRGNNSAYPSQKLGDQTN